MSKYISKNVNSNKRRTTPRKLKEMCPVLQEGSTPIEPEIYTPKSAAVKKIITADEKAKTQQPQSKSQVSQAGLRYLKAGLSIIATKPDKTPAASWELEQFMPAKPEELKEQLLKPYVTGIGIVCGHVSGDLECLDFDAAGEMFPVWGDMVEEDCPGLLKKLVVERSPSGGKHVLYRCSEADIPGAKKLAMRPVTDSGANKQTVLIETRGEKAYVVCDPSPGYVLLQGTLSKVPEITSREREILLQCARMLDERTDGTRPDIASPGNSRAGLRPGDDYNRRGNIRELLQKHGWVFIRRVGANEHWRRPGKKDGTSATLKMENGIPIFYNFSSSVNIDSNRGLNPFQVYVALEHGNDYSQASSTLRQLGYGDNVKMRQFNTTKDNNTHTFTVSVGNGKSVTITVECD